MDQETLLELIICVFDNKLTSLIDILEGGPKRLLISKKVWGVHKRVLMAFKNYQTFADISQHPMDFILVIVTD